MPKAVKTTSTSTIAPVTGRRRLATGAALLAAFGSVGPFAGSAEAAARVDTDSAATSEDFASIDFEPVPGLAESMGNRTEWLAKMGDRYPTMWIGAATMRMTPQELTDMASKEPDAIANMISCILDLRDSLEAESEVMKVAAIRLISGCCRAGLV